MKQLIILIIVFLACKVSFAQNLFLNGGFETANVGMPSGTSNPFYPTLLNNWAAVNTDGELIYSSTFAHSGTGFLSVLQNQGMNPRKFWLGALSIMSGYDRAIQVMPVSPSITYHFQCWVRSGNNLRYATYGAGRMLVQIEQVSPTNISIDSISVYTSTSWQQLSLTFTTGPSCSSVAILFSCYDVANADVWVDDVDLRTGGTDAISAISSPSGISIFPNPITDKLTISAPDRGNVLEIMLYDITSKKLLREDFTNSITLNTGHLEKGIYFYELRDHNSIIKTGKIIK